MKACRKRNGVREEWSTTMRPEEMVHAESLVPKIACAIIPTAIQIAYENVIL